VTALWVRAAIFTIAVPIMVGGVVPWTLTAGGARFDTPGLVGLALVAAGTYLYLLCVRQFLRAGGTPSIFFLKPLRALIGEEPPRVVRAGPYRYTRNPMYAGVVLAIAGQALLFWSPSIAMYGVGMFVAFTLVVMAIEEPHLKRRFGAHYEDYMMRVPRWL
jgi:protein-S-isoprenylcysteine O-methyltransferase Ste14